MRKPSVWSVLVIGAACAGCGGTAPQRGGAGDVVPGTSAPEERTAPMKPILIDFEDLAIGAVPSGWRAGDEGASATFVVGERADAGDNVRALAASTAAGADARFLLSLPIAQVRGRRLVIAADAAGHAQGVGAGGAVGLVVGRAAGTAWSNEARSARIDEAAWRRYATAVDVPKDATRADVAVWLTGTATVSIDDLTVTDVGVSGVGDAPPARLEGRGLDNVVALARLYGIVRYFHPSDEAAALDDAAWERFLVRAVQAVEPAADAEALATTLTELFAPLAPSAQVFAGEPSPPARAPAPEASADNVRWLRTGLYSGARTHRDPDLRSPLELIATLVDVSAWRGKTLRLRGAVRAASGAGGGGVWLQRELPAGQPPPAQSPLTSGDDTSWSARELDVQIGEDDQRLWVGVYAAGDGPVWFEPLSLVVVDGRHELEVPLPAWLDEHGLRAGWHRFSLGDVEPGGSRCRRRRPCVALTAPPRPRDAPWEGPLAGGVSARVPVVVSSVDGATVPAATVPFVDDGAVPVMTDRGARLASVIIAWNAPQHFYPYFDVTSVDWPAELRRALSRAALDTDLESLVTTLRTLYAALRDGHGYVVHPAQPREAIAPWDWERVEGDLVITWVDPGCDCGLRLGDVVTSIDGVPTADVFIREAQVWSAATPQFLDHLVRDGLRDGRLGSTVRLGLLRGESTHAATVARRPTSEGIAARKAARRPDGQELAPGIRYFDLRGASAEALAASIEVLASADAVVFDLRGYTGPGAWDALTHITDRLVATPQWHTPRVPRPDRDEMTFWRSSWDTAPAKPRIRRAVFVTDGSAVSASETVLGIVAGNGLGEIVGEPTAGTNGNEVEVDLPGAVWVWFTGMKVLALDGGRHHGVGVMPTVPASRTIAGVAAGRDEVLERAIEVARAGGVAAP